MSENPPVFAQTSGLPSKIIDLSYGTGVADKDISDVIESIDHKRLARQYDNEESRCDAVGTELHSAGDTYRIHCSLWSLF